MHEALIAIYIVGHFALHFPIVFPILDIMPDWLVRRAQPEVLPVVVLRKDLARQIRDMRKGVNEGHKYAKHITIFQELLNSDLPEEEKSDARLGDEAQLIVAAGLITTSWALSVASFHIINNPYIYRKLLKELKGAVSVRSTLDGHKLEQLPYLNGCVHEGVRLAHGISTRSPRLAPDMELKYGEWVVPKNTPVSMTAVDILMNESIFPDPKIFKPERWIGRPDLDRYFCPLWQRFTSLRGYQECLPTPSWPLSC